MLYLINYLESVNKYHLKFAIDFSQIALNWKSLL